MHIPVSQVATVNLDAECFEIAAHNPLPVQVQNLELDFPIRVLID